MEILLLIPVFVLWFIVSRWMTELGAHRRIREYFDSIGGEVISISWLPFARNPLERQSPNLYSVTFRDREGAVQTVDCKTSPMEGVYFAERSGDPLAMNLDASPSPMAAENRRLRRELERLKTETREPEAPT